MPNVARVALLAIAAVGCGHAVPAGGARSGEPIRHPLTPEAMIRGGFVARTLLWQVDVPGGDPIVFHSNGQVENARAGLAGRWTILDDSTLVIHSGSTSPLDRPTSRAFRLRSPEGDLVSPVPDSTGRAALFTIHHTHPR